jgi:hypothetical protein
MRETTGVVSALLLGGAIGCSPGFDCRPPDIVISSSADWTAFTRAGCTNVAGQLTIAAPDLTSLTPPATALISVGSLYVSGNAALTTLELPALATISGDLIISFDGDLTRVSLPALDSVQGIVNIGSDVALTTLELPALQSVGTLEIGSMAAPTLSFPGLQRVHGFLAVDGEVTGPQDSSALISIDFPVLSNVGSSIGVTNQPLLAHAGFPALSSAGSIIFYINAALQDLSFPSLTFLSNDIDLYMNGALTGADFPLLQNVPGLLFIQLNTQLTTLSFPALTSVGQFLYIWNNQSLRQCVADGLVARLSTTPRSVFFADNLGTPNICP